VIKEAIAKRPAQRPARKVAAARGNKLAVNESKRETQSQKPTKAGLDRYGRTERQRERKWITTPNNRGRREVLRVERLEDIPGELQRLLEKQVAEPLSPTMWLHKLSSLLNFAAKDRFVGPTRGQPDRRRELAHAERKVASRVCSPVLMSLAQLRNMEMVWHQLKKNHTPSSTNYTVMMSAYTRAGHADAAVALFEEMKRSPRCKV
jgi:pentatricopeptide repeat protein